MAKRAMTDEAKALKAQAILDQAARMLEESEYNHIKMSDIAKEMKMSKGILFVYFKTKEALFFNLLCREYENRLIRFTELINIHPIKTFNDFKHLIMTELIELIDHKPLYIRLEAMRSTVLEINVDAEMMLELKTKLYLQMMEMISFICKDNVLMESEVMDIFQAQASIIIGCKSSTSIPAEVTAIIEEKKMDGFKRDFKADVTATMEYYLDGYLYQKQQ
ncbi:TetR/AcrR family transcriptional regulator [Paenibacillus peoriae]|uniref:TetR/AcrR family transcriptional regulator n=1 Tax=Paenibacillus peoriae TaxID=59893 RepID=A0A7H0YCW4_9BACL|nr:TetR/AcrR family transcriptional regulator [Paenibacillus peoriae]QNR68922.1 TetR/AcrR family transcriptional regulator [Paenibacillus peoriae]